MAKLEKLIKEIIKFNRAHGWQPTAVDCAKSIVIEAAELLEHFQWDDSNGLEKRGLAQKDWEEIKLELADVFWYLIAFCQAAEFDLSECVDKKIKHNKKKYPSDMFNGRHNEKFYREQKERYRKAHRKNQTSGFKKTL
ncbi:MAG TPA: MazG-like family protein [Candidatus Bathyarchaeia archaeon]|nr:MazG-like family protein [Candidatus Bathyarchaeia archaeon]